MDDLISRKALLAFGGARTIKDAVGNWDELDNKAKAAVLRCASKIKKLIVEAPAVDAVEVKHGYWDDSGRYKFANGEIAIMCSTCGCCLHKDEYESYYWNYCPCCGSRMDGERRKNEY